jgi:hypothetical protein
MVSHGDGPVFSPDTPSAEIRLVGGLLEGGRLSVTSGENVVIDGLKMTGMSMIEVLGGKNTVIQNVVMTEGVANWQAGWPGAVRTAAGGTKILFNTVIMQTETNLSAAVAIDATASKTVVVGNIFESDALIRPTYDGPLDLVSNHNLFLPGMTLGTGQYLSQVMTIGEWRAASWDQESVLSAAEFADRANDDFHLCSGSTGSQWTNLETDAKGVLFDFDGKARNPDRFDVGVFVDEECNPRPAIAAMRRLKQSTLKQG